MHQSLYRKYRPQTFDEVVGQKVIIRTLKNVILKNKISHAYLFSGPRGTGKTSVAKIMAKTVNCVDLKDTNPCNECVNCTQINKKQSIDIIEIDAASNNGVDEIRELKSKVNLVPSTGKYKIYIIDEVHMLTIGAFNALLKTLEEPPPHIIFILATTEPHKIPETILSRCQKFDFKKIDDKSMNNRISYICKSEKIDIEDTAKEAIIRFSSGGMRDAISLLEQANVYSDTKITLDDIHEINGTLPEEQLKKLIESIIDKDLIKIFKLVEKYDEDGKNLIKLVEEIVLFFKNIIIFKNIDGYSNKNISREIFIDIIDKVSTEEVFQIISKINNSLNEMKSYNNPKMIFELLMVSIVSKDNEQLVSIEVEDSAKKDTPKTNDKPLSKITENNKEINQKKINSLNDSENIVENLKPEQTNGNRKTKETDELINTIKEIRVNNAFSKASRAVLNNLQKNIEVLTKYLLDENYGKVASLLLDSEITAASDTNIVFVYTSNSMVKNFNNNILKIESFIQKIFNNNCKVIALNKEEWSDYRKQYKSKTKKYVYIKEDDQIKQFLEDQIVKTTSTEEIQNLFQEIIEYK